MSKKGYMIVVEGLEGAGKSTALQIIEAYLLQRVPHLVLVREPGGTLLGEAIRQWVKGDESMDPRTELLLFYASRIELVEQVIRPTLDKGGWVLADRFELSTFAYQGGGRGIDETFIRQLSAFAVKDFQPSLTIFLDISPEIGLKRALQRGQHDRIEQEALPFFQRVYDRYHQHIKGLHSVVIIDAHQPLNRVTTSIHHALETFISGVLS